MENRKEFDFHYFEQRYKQQPPKTRPAIMDAVSLDHNQSVRLMCSYGGKIVPNLQGNNTLRYLGGDTKLISISKTTTFSSLHSKLSKITTSTYISIKYQLPDRQLDSLVTVLSDDDVKVMINEMDKSRCKSKSRRLRVFLFENNAEIDSSEENWFFDVGRERSETSSIVSEVPDYLTGLDNPVELDIKYGIGFCETVGWDVDSPGPGVLSATPFASTPIMQPKAMPESPDGLALDQKAVGLSSCPWETGKMVQESDKYLGYQGLMPRPVPTPVYFVPSSGPPPLGNAHIQPGPIPNPYVQQYPVLSGHMGFHPMVPSFGAAYGRPMRPTYGGSKQPVGLDPFVQARVVGGEPTQPLYFTANNGPIFTPGNHAPVSTQGTRNTSWMLQT